MPRGQLSTATNNTFREGDEKAFDHLFRTYYPALCFFAQRYLKDTDAARDLVQECFIKLWERNVKIENSETIRSYLYTTVRNKCIDALRKNKVREAGLLKVPPATEDWDAVATREVIFTETMRQLDAAIQVLPPKMQAVFRLYYLEGKKYEEIAAALNVSARTVRNQKERALTLLKEKLLLPAGLLFLFL